MKRITRKSFECEGSEVNEAIWKLAKEYACYEGDPIDDWREYTNKSGSKCVIVMTPVGEKLVFTAFKLEDGAYIVEIIASSWRKI